MVLDQFSCWEAQKKEKVFNAHSKPDTRSCPCVKYVRAKATWEQIRCLGHNNVLPSVGPPTWLLSNYWEDELFCGRVQLRFSLTFFDWHFTIYTKNCTFWLQYLGSFPVRAVDQSTRANLVRKQLSIMKVNSILILIFKMESKIYIFFCWRMFRPRDPCWSTYHLKALKSAVRRVR